VGSAGSAASTAVGSPSPSPSASNPTIASAASTSAAAADCPDPGPTHHDAPELESTLPSVVAGRELARWSIVGTCLLHAAVGSSSTDRATFLARADAVDPTHAIDLAELRYAVAGRSHVKTDPPYFVFAAKRSRSEEEIGFSMLLLFGLAGVHDPVGAAKLDGYEERSIGSRTVYVGSADMLDQTEHIRGRPYLYQTDDAMYLVVTDDDKWALEAIKQLP